MEGFPPEAKGETMQIASHFFLQLILSFFFQETSPSTQQPRNMKTPNHTFQKLAEEQLFAALENCPNVMIDI